MNEDFSIFEFNEMMNKGEEIYTRTTEKAFVDIRKYGNLVLLQLKQYHGKEKGEQIRFNDVIEIIENKLRQKLELIKFRRIEGLFETDYYYIFILK